MQIKYKMLHEKAVLPKHINLGDAGVDLTAISKEYDEVNNVVIFGTGLAVEIPEGYAGLLFPRSSIYKTPLSLANCVGVLDSSYRGEIKAMFRTIDRPRKNYDVGDRIIQLVIVPFVSQEPVIVDELSSTQRGLGGFGSTG